MLQWTAILDNKFRGYVARAIHQYCTANGAQNEECELPGCVFIVVLILLVQWHQKSCNWCKQSEMHGKYRQSLIQLIWRLSNSHTYKSYFPAAARFKIGGLIKFQFVEFAINAGKSYDINVLRTFRFALCLLRVTILVSLTAFRSTKLKHSWDLIFQHVFSEWNIW